LFFLPPYSPDLNPDELVWNHLKTHTVGRTTTDSKQSFRGKVLSSMRSLQNTPKKSPHSFKNHHSNMPRECRHINELINNRMHRVYDKDTHEGTHAPTPMTSARRAGFVVIKTHLSFGF
jgi:hypothetical protein